MEIKSQVYFSISNFAAVYLQRLEQMKGDYCCEVAFLPEVLSLVLSLIRGVSPKFEEWGGNSNPPVPLCQ